MNVATCPGSLPWFLGIFAVTHRREDRRRRQKVRCLACSGAGGTPALQAGFDAGAGIEIVAQGVSHEIE